MSDEPANLVLELLRGIRSEMAELRADLKGEIAELRSEIRSLRADVAADLLAMDAKNAREHQSTRDQLAGLRRDVIAYHSSVVGHGVLIGELDDRLRRVEQHLALPPMDAH